MELDIQEIVDQLIDTVTVYGLDVIGALVILILGWMIAGWVRSSVNKGLSKIPNMDGTLRPFIANLVRWIFLAFVIIAVLNQFGVETTSFIAVLGAAGLAIGLALQGTLSNVASGVMLLILRPFKTGDFIDAGGLAGTVIEIGLFTSEIKTGDGVYVMAPNSQIWNSTIKNFSRNPTRRIDILMGVSYNDNIDIAQKTLQAVMDADDRVIKDPAATTMVMSLGASSVDINMRFWVNNADYWSVLFDTNKAAKIAIEAAGCSIPYPQQDVHMHNVDK